MNNLDDKILIEYTEYLFKRGYISEGLDLKGIVEGFIRRKIEGKE